MAASWEIIEISDIMNHGDAQTGSAVHMAYQGMEENGTVPWMLLPSAGEHYLLKELAWYVEEYAAKDPFNSGAKEKMDDALHEYGSLLTRFIDATLSNASKLAQSDIIVKVKDESTEPTLETVQGTRVVTLLQWECIERLELWPEACRPKRVLVVRCTARAGNVGEDNEVLSAFSSQDSARARRVLALSARPDDANDIPHRIVTRMVHDVIHSLQEEVDPPPEFRIARPGSLAGLERALAAQPVGFFDIVHLDVHGTANTERAMLVFWSETGRSAEHHLEAAELAKLLRRYRARCVVMNACQSAAPGHNFAKTLVQHGIPMVLGMQFKLLDSAAEAVVAPLYRALLGQQLSMPEACTFARRQLRLDDTRQTNFNIKVHVQDFMNPVLFIDSKLDMKRLMRFIGSPQDQVQVMSLPKRRVPTLVSAGESKHFQMILAREPVILQLENAFFGSKKVQFISGPPGTGKSALAGHVSWWWTATGMIDGVLMIDFADFTTPMSVEWPAIVACLCSQVSGRPDVVDEATLSEHLQTRRYLVVFDSVDELGVSIPRQFLDAVLGFIKPIRRAFRESMDGSDPGHGSRQDSGAAPRSSPRPGSLFLFLGRRGDCRIGTKVAAQEVFLDRLDVASGLEFCLGLLSDRQVAIQLTDSKEIYHLEQIVSMLEGNPLAMQLIMDDFVNRELENFSDYYEQLTSNAPIEIDDSLQTQHTIRQIMGIIAGGWSFDPFPCLRRHILYLSPFWNVIPESFAPYWKFLQLAYERVKALEDSGPWSKADIKAVAEEMSKGEEECLDSPLGWTSTPELKSLQAEFDAALSSISIDHLLGDKTAVEPDLESPIVGRYYKISPIVTICLRALTHACDGKTDEDDDYSFYMYQCITQIAFERYHKWRHRYVVNNKRIRPSALRYEFGNYITVINFTLYTSPELESHYFLEAFLFYLLGSRERQMFITLPIAHRAITICADEIRRMPPVWKDQITANSLPSMLQYIHGSITAERCFGLLRYAVDYTARLGYPITTYTTMVAEMKHILASWEPSPNTRDHLLKIYQVVQEESEDLIFVPRNAAAGTLADPRGFIPMELTQNRREIIADR